MWSVTESEAKKLWCPMARVVSDDGGSYNRVSMSDVKLLPDSARCVASQCMMWQWDFSSQPDNQNADTAASLAIKPRSRPHVRDHNRQTMLHEMAKEYVQCMKRFD